MVITSLQQLCYLLLIGLVIGNRQKDTITVQLERKPVGISASETRNKIQNQLLRSGGFGDMFGQKNVDSHGPVEDILNEFDTEEEVQQKSVFEQISEWFTSFAPKTASPYGGEISSTNSANQLGMVDFSDMHHIPLKKRLYESVQKHEEKQNKGKYQPLNQNGNHTHQHPRVKADTKIDMSNYLNLQYIGPLYMGSADQQVSVIYDTGSDWLVLDTDFCSTCITPVFNTSASTSYVNVSTDQITQAYGSALLYAVNATDDTSMEDPASSTGTQISAFNFLAITWQTGIRETFDGIIGFSRQYYTDSFSSGPLFVEALKNESMITREQISFYMTDTSGTSFADLGAYVTSNMKDGDIGNIAWLYMPSEHLFWYSNVQAIKIGYGTRSPGSGFVSSWKLGAERAGIFDTGTSLIYIPLADSDDFFYRLLKDKTYLYDNGFFYVDCSEKSNYADVQLLINNKWFVVSATDYFQEISGSCYLAFVEDISSSYWLIGDAFLRGYYSIHDNEDHTNAKLGFIPHANSIKPHIGYGDVPETTTTDLQWERTWIYDIYWAFQIEPWADTWLDNKWYYQWQGQVWYLLFGASSIRRSTLSYY